MSGPPMTAKNVHDCHRRVKQPSDDQQEELVDVPPHQYRRKGGTQNFMWRSGWVYG